MHPQAIDLIAGGLFAAALVHSFAANQLPRPSMRFPRHAGLLHLLGEVEVVFGFWGTGVRISVRLEQPPRSVMIRHFDSERRLGTHRPFQADLSRSPVRS